MARIKKRLDQEPDKLLTTKPVKGQLSMDDFVSSSKKQTKYEFDVVPNPNKAKGSKPAKKSKKKMDLDSDEEEEDEWSEYEDDEDDDLYN